MNIRSLNTKNTNISFDKTKHNENAFKISEGDIVKVKLIEYLGGGKMVIDLKGQRVVANSDLMMEEGQDVSVLIKKINSDKIILQILSDNLTDKKNEQNIEFSLINYINEFKKIIKSNEHSKTLLLDDEIKKLSDLLDKEFINISDSITKEDLVNQIKNSLLLGYKYENKDDFIHILLALPIFFDKKETDVEIDYSYSKNNEDENKTSNISIIFDLNEFGKIEFVINIIDDSLNCLIKTDNNDIFELIKKNSSELKNGFAKIGYNIVNLNCIIQDFIKPIYCQTAHLIDKNV